MQCIKKRHKYAYLVWKIKINQSAVKFCKPHSEFACWCCWCLASGACAREKKRGQVDAVEIFAGEKGENTTNFKKMH